MFVLPCSERNGWVTFETVLFWKSFSGIMQSVSSCFLSIYRDAVLVLKYEMASTRPGVLRTGHAQRLCAKDLRREHQLRKASEKLWARFSLLSLCEQGMIFWSL